MRKSLVLLVFLAGCGSVSDPNDPRLQVTDRLRSECQGTVYASDGEIRSILNLEEIDRLNGFSFMEQIAILSSQCVSDGCFTCRTAILEQLYGL